jgi:prolyl-tRNA synthetase
MVLAMTHEEVVADLVRKEISSYRQLPALIYQFQTKWRDELRPRAGLMRTREFVMKDGYSMDVDESGLDRQYRTHYQAYYNIFRRCGLPVMAVVSDSGIMGGKLAHEFMYLSPVGEDTLLIDETTGYAANREVSVFQKPAAEPEDALPLEKIETPNTTTIESLARYLDIPVARTAKAVFKVATIVEDQQDIERFIFAVVRGDMELNEVKLANAVSAKLLRPATEAEIRAIGAEPGYGSPIGVHDCLVIVDDAIPTSPNLVAGANEAGYHYKNVNYGRDFTAAVITDLAVAREGDRSIGGGTLTALRGVEVGHIYKLGTYYTDPMNANFQDENGHARSVVMGSYGIGMGRLMACIAEEYHDENGLRWPVTVAPFLVHIVRLPGDKAAEAAETVYEQLQKAGIDVLFDDRDERAGVKFNDADLIGAPLRITVSERALERGGLELKRRDREDREIVPLENIVAAVQAEIEIMTAAVEAAVTAVPYTA